jgi:NADH:ubiquinone oxidoreductase subunit F (NADH-binding)
MHRILEKITRGTGTSRDLEMLEQLCGLLKETSLCGLGQTAPNPVVSTLRYFRDEYLAHIEERRCPAGVCPVGTAEAAEVQA